MPGELRADPALLDELRGGTPTGAYELRSVGPTLDDYIYYEARLEKRGESERGIYRAGGLGIVYNSRSVNLGGFVEVIRPGAARDVLSRGPDVRALFNHNPDLVLGRTLASTLRLSESDIGTDYEFDAPDTSYARDLGVLLDRGDITQSSFAFRVTADGVEWSEDEETGLLLRIIHRFAALSDMSPVTYPAYPASTSGKRGALSVELDATVEVDDPDEEARAAEARLARTALRTRRLRLRGRA